MTSGHRVGGTIVNNDRTIGVLSMGDEVNHLVGNAPTKLDKPGNGETVLVMHIEAGSFRAKVGDHLSGDLSTYQNVPSATVTDGTGGIKLESGKTYTVQAPNEITVIGDSSSSILTYWWI